MAVVRNITADTRSLFASDAPPVRPGDSVTVSDGRFAGRAWPKETWELVTKPKGFIDASTDDAYLYVEEPDETVADLKQRAADEGVDISGLTKKADIAAALASGPTTEENV